MRNTWSGLGLLLVVPWLAGCVTRPEIRLDTGQGPPIIYTPPAAEPPPVEIRQAEFVSSLTDLVLHLPLTLVPSRRAGRVVLASWGESRDMAQQVLPSQCAPAEPPDGCLMLPRNSPPPEALARMRLALSFAMDSVWEGAAVPISEILDPLAFKLMVYTALSTYLLMLMMPEPVTKGLAAVLTLYLVAYLGLGPVWAMAEAGWRLLEDSQRATTTEELKQAGLQFGRALGDNGMRVLLLLATAAIGGEEGFVGKGPNLPGFSRAALASPARTGVSLEAAGQVRTVVLGAKGLIVGLAPAAVAATMGGPGSALLSEENPQVGDRNDAHPPQGLLDSQAKHIAKIDNILRDHATPGDFEGVAKELTGRRISKPDGSYWDHIGEMRQSVRDLKKHVRALEGSLENPNHAPDVRTYVQQAIEKGKAMISRMEAALAGDVRNGR